MPKITQPVPSEISHSMLTTGKPEISAILSYRNNRFSLRLTGNTEAFTKDLAHDAHWKKVSPDLFETQSLAAAVRVRRLADPPTKEILNRRLQCRYALPDPGPYVTAIEPHLDTHQWRGLEWILTRKRSYLAHAPGAGKTITALAAAYIALEAAPPGHQALLIVPPTLVANWAREVARVSAWLNIWPGVGVITAGRVATAIAWEADLVICSDTMLSRTDIYRTLLLREKCFLAVDEASRFKDWQAERSLRLYGGSNGKDHFPGLYQKARHVVFLDGSPMPNRPIELWAPTFALDPEAIDCRDYDDFGYYFCGAKPNPRGQWEYLWSSHEDELQKRLTDSFMHVVKEEELSHPERRRSLLYIPKEIRTPEMRDWERRNISEVTFDSLQEGMSQGEIASYRKELGLRKVPFITRYVGDRLEGKNESILLFCWHREVLTRLGVSLDRFSPGLIYGGIPESRREILMREFQEGKRKILILNIAAAARGHNLQKANRVIFAEYSWTDELNKQAEKRASRRGSEKEYVRCEYIVAPKSMDEIVLKSLFTKERRVRKVIG